jgi:hypothetical protein
VLPVNVGEVHLLAVLLIRNMFQTVGTLPPSVAFAYFGIRVPPDRSLHDRRALCEAMHAHGQEH